MANDKQREFTVNALARSVGVTRKTLYQWHAEGCPLTTGPEVVAWAAAHCKQLPTTTRPQPADDRAGWTDSLELAFGAVRREFTRLESEAAANSDSAERAYRLRWVHDELVAKAKSLSDMADAMQPLPSVFEMTAEDRETLGEGE